MSRKYRVFPYPGELPGTSADKESTWNAGDPGSIPGLGRSPGEGKGYPLQYSDLENSIDYTQYMGSQRVYIYISPLPLCKLSGARLVQCLLLPTKTPGIKISEGMDG